MADKHGFSEEKNNLVANSAEHWIYSKLKKTLANVKENFELYRFDLALIPSMSSYGTTTAIGTLNQPKSHF